MSNPVTDYPMVAANWPPNRPHPTPEEWAAAETRYKTEMRELYSGGYAGDAGMGLGFMMATYNPNWWWHFFFPNERLDQ